MKLIIAGSRDVELEEHQISKLLEILMPGIVSSITEVVSGGCKGIDQCGEKFAKICGFPIKQFLPDWSMGLSAGPVRNKKMAQYGDMLFLIHHNSKGSINMKKEMLALNKPVLEICYFEAKTKEIE